MPENRAYVSMHSKLYDSALFFFILHIPFRFGNFWFFFQFTSSKALNCLYRSFIEALIYVPCGTSSGGINLFFFPRRTIVWTKFSHSKWMSDEIYIYIEKGNQKKNWLKHINSCTLHAYIWCFLFLLYWHGHFDNSAWAHSTYSVFSNSVRSAMS